MSPLTLAALLEARKSGHAIVLATRLADGAQHILPALVGPVVLRENAARALASDVSQVVDIDGERWFLAVHAQPFRLLIVGAVHIAQALAPLAAAMGMVATVIDPRRSFASPARFPDVALDHRWPDDGLIALAPDRRTAIVTLTHDPKLDDPALDRALHTDAFYIGALGSRKTHAARLQRLAASGYDAASLSRIRGPAGLPVGALTAPEIALSIIAEIVAVRRGGALVRHRERRLPRPHGIRRHAGG